MMDSDFDFQIHIAQPYNKRITRLKSRIGRVILPILFPAHCPVCGKLVPYDHHACNPCYGKLPFVRQPCCCRCGKPVPDSSQEYCRDCRMFPKSFHAGCSLFLYNEVTKPSILDYKYHNRRVLTDFYTDELLLRYYPLFRKWDIRAVIPVPVHIDKKRQRGYNQAELLSRRIAGALGIPHYPDMLCRVVNTLPQKQFSPQARLNNLKQAFVLNPRFRLMKKKPGHVLLVDDIYTTGATMEACARVLLGSGIGRVYVCSVCIGVSRE